MSYLLQQIKRWIFFQNFPKIISLAMNQTWVNKLIRINQKTLLQTYIYDHDREINIMSYNQG